MSGIFMFGVNQELKIEQALGRNGANRADIEWLSSESNFLKVISLARGESVLAQQAGQASSDVGRVVSGRYRLGTGQKIKLERALGRNQGTSTDAEWLCMGDNLKKVFSLANGESLLAEGESVPAEEDAPISTLIRVDRSIKPVSYSEWMSNLIHPELEGQGPTEYDLASVELWLDKDQKNEELVHGTSLYSGLDKCDLLRSCLTVRDGEEIRKNGIAAFRKLFGRKSLLLWGSAARLMNWNAVPFLFDGGNGEVLMDWYWIEGYFGDNQPGGRFPG